ncbi:hydrolase [Thermodesulfobacteriota bacterium]
MLSDEKTALIVVDVQEKLLNVMYEKEAVVENLQKLIKSANLLDIPIVWTEQNPKGIGPTVSEIKDLMPGDIKPISKFSFSCCQNDQFMDILKATNRTQILMTGIETHVCVCQTSVDLFGLGYEVEVVSDAVSSRTPQNKEVGLTKMKGEGIALTSVETAIFELLKDAGHEKFKGILKIIK